MPLTTSLIPSVVDALVSTLTAALPSITVRDGQDTASQEKAELQIGADVEGGDFPWDQRWAGLGHVSRDETFEVPCLLFVRSGNGVLKPERDAAFGYMAAVETALRSNPSLGLASNSVRAQVTPALYSQFRTSGGVVIRLHFYINVEGRL